MMVVTFQFFVADQRQPDISGTPDDFATPVEVRGGEEQNARRRAQWEILAATYVRLADQSKKVDDTGTYSDPRWIAPEADKKKGPRRR